MWHKLDLNRSINKLYFYKRENFRFYFFVTIQIASLFVFHSSIAFGFNASQERDYATP